MTLRQILIGSGIILFIFFHFLYYFDWGSGCRIFIVPAFLEWNSDTIKEALAIEKQTLPDYYAMTCRYVRVIHPFLGCGGFEGGCFYPEKPQSIYVSTAQNELMWTVAVIAHESCHARQHFEHRFMDESECYAIDSDALHRMAVYLDPHD